MQNDNLEGCKKSLNLKFENSALEHVKNLTVQGYLVTAIINFLPPSQISKWVKEAELLSTSLFCFARKALQQQLPTAANLQRWGKLNNGLCVLCGKLQSNKHVLNNCSAPVALERYKVRHDAVLHIICNWLLNCIDTNNVLHADIVLDKVKPVEDIFNRLRPDIVVVTPGKVQVLELTICHESNFAKSKQYKLDKYRNLREELKIQSPNLNFQVFTLEISSLGLMENCSHIIKEMINSKLPQQIYRDIVRSVSGNSYNIYRNRDNKA